MKIETAAAAAQPTFHELKFGDCFLYSNTPYIKIDAITVLTGNMDTCTRTVNAIRLRDGHPSTFERKTIVNHLPNATVKY
ncbi:hypothetical protein C121_48 [Stenotrophomonas phage C121]|uniref:hypothetical protein n=1 Tax=Stenotrophomonas phage C121 TaxID=2914029 RepID=UPI002329235C|nr:hypothetical protein PP752_gp48 [Stenotrophomonas phage C121]UKL14781.1 hypothetical protein C121_48 [Stenotrophomonas phage C121]